MPSPLPPSPSVLVFDEPAGIHMERPSWMVERSSTTRKPSAVSPVESEIWPEISAAGVSVRLTSGMSGLTCTECHALTEGPSSPGPVYLNAAGSQGD